MFFQSLSRLLQVTYFVTCIGEPSKGWIPKNHIQVQNWGRKFRRRLCTSSVQREIRPVSRRSRAVTAKKCTKKCDAHAKLLFWLLNLFVFVTFSLPLPSPSSYLKVAINRGVRKLKGRRRRWERHLKSESGPFHTSPLLSPSHSIRQLLANFCGFDF